MTSVTRFPHYHQAENVVTNHVMVMLRTLYNHSPLQLERLLKSLCEVELVVGPSFSQQVGGALSVPDGLILQTPFAVFVETKLGSMASAEQLSRHCQTIVERIPNRTGSILISLTSAPSKQPLPETVLTVARQRGLTVVPVTFEGLLTEIEQLPIADPAIREIAEEFADFIVSQGLVSRKEQTMVAVLAGTSWADNLSHGVYFEPAHRNPKWQRAAHLGLYHRKQVSHIGRISAVVAARVGSDGDLEIETPEVGELGAAGRRRILDIIAIAEDYFPGFSLVPHRYYVVDAFSPTSFGKSSPGGMMGHRYFDVEVASNIRLQPGAPGATAATALVGREFT